MKMCKKVSPRSDKPTRVHSHEEDEYFFKQNMGENNHFSESLLGIVEIFHLVFSSLGCCDLEFFQLLSSSRMNQRELASSNVSAQTISYFRDN